MEHLVGYVIIALSVLSVGGIFGFQWLQWQKKKPKEFYRGVGIIYQKGADKPWAGMRELIDSILDQQEHENSQFKDLKDWGDFWVEVVSFNEPIRTKGQPTGYIWDFPKGTPEAAKNGYPCPPPATDEEDKFKAIVNGTRSMKQMLPGTKKHWTIVVRQLRHGVSNHDMTMLRGEGKTRSAGWSAAHHEHAEHFVSSILGRGLNVYHDQQDLKDLKQRMRERYNDLHTEEMT